MRSVTLRLALSLWLPLALTGCAARQAFNEGTSLFDSGQPERGLVRLNDAVRLEPGQAEYRLALITRKTTYVNAQLKQAEQARAQEQLDGAEKIYRNVLRLEPDNVMARQGLDGIARDRHHGEMLYEAASLIDKQQDIPRAIDILRSVQAADPANTRAAMLMNRARTLLPLAEKNNVKLATAFQKPVTLDFRDAPLSAVFDMIGKASGLNFFFDREVKSDLKTTIMARNIPIENAIRVITTTNQLAVRPLDDSSLLVYPDTPAKQKDYLPVSVRTFHVANADVKAVTNTLKTILSLKDVVADERLNLIIVRDTPEVLRAVEKLVALQDQGDPEILLDVEVLEIQHDRMTEVGVTWPDSLTLSPLATTTTTGTTTTSSLTLNQLLNLNRDRIQSSVPSATATVHDENQDSNILANPRIRVKNKEKAKILIGNKLPVFTSTSTSTGFLSESVSYLDVGLKLEVEPNISVDQDVDIRINLEVSSIVNQVTSKGGTQAYQIGTRNASTVLQLRDGETQLLAGLINDQERASGVGLPLLRNLPLLGHLFGTPINSKQRSEIVLSITPHVLRSVKRQDLFEAEFESGTESSVGRNPLHFDVVPEKGVKDQQPVPAGEAPKALTPSAPTPSPMPSAAPTPVQAAVAPSKTVFSWSAPASVREGETLSLSLAINAPQGLQSLPLTLAYDPNVLEVQSVQEGDALRKAGIASSFGSRIDASQGRIQVTLARQAPADAGVALPAASGDVVQLRFKARKALSGTDVSLLAASAGTGDAALMSLPLSTRIAVSKP